MKNFTRLLLLFAFLFSFLGMEAQVTIGTGTLTARYPINFWYQHGRHVAIYTATEMNTVAAGGTITTLTWTAVNATFGGSVKIKLLECGAQTTIASSASYATETAGATTVYTSASFTPTAGANLIDITDFAINANQNLKIIVETDNDPANTPTCDGQGTSTSNTFNYTASPAGSGVYFDYDDTGTGPACVAGTIGSALQISHRPNITIGGLTPPAAPDCATLNTPTNGATGIVRNTPLTWTAAGTGGTATAFKVYLGTVNPPTTLVSTITAPTATYTPTGQTYNTVYYWYIVPTGPGGDAVGCNATVNSYTTELAPPPPANDNICGAVSLSISSGLTCTTLLTGQSTENATAGAAACAGTGADDDVWYSFVATSTSHIITLSTSGAGSTDRVHQLYSSSDNTCSGTLTSLTCSDPETSTTSGLTIGNTYFLRVHSYGTGNFATYAICITTPPPPPANDLICGAVSLSISSGLTCTTLLTGQSTQYATAGAAACVGSGADDDVWYSFVATSTTHIITLSTSGAGSTDRVHQLYSSSNNTCSGTLTSLTCSDPETSTTSGLTIGNTYFLRVHSYSTGNFATYDICITSPPPPPANDLICGAVSLSISPGLTCTTLLTGQSTQSATAGSAACVGTGADDDVWYSFVATSTSHIITLSGVSVGGSSVDRVHQLYSSSNNTCSGTLTSLTCSDPETSTTTGLTIGNTYFLRVHSYSTGNFATFDICITSVVPPACTTNTAPSNGATGVALLPTLTWTAAAGATSYDIYFVGTLPTGWVNPVNTASTSYTILLANTLLANTTYTWYVAPRNSVGAATGCSSNTTTFTTVAAPTTFSGTGNWSDPARWSAGVPSCSSPVSIALGAVCAVDIAAVAGSVTVAGTLNVAANSLTMGCTSGGGNRVLSVSGTLNVSGGTLTINGSMIVNVSAKFFQSGGDIVIDGNAAGVAGNSVSGTPILSLSPSVAGDLALTGGTLTIVDPHVATTNTFEVNYPVIGAVTASTSHTIRFGDGVSTDPGSASGFLFYSWAGSGIFRFGNVEILGSPSGANRFVNISTSFFNFVVTGNMTIGTNAEFRQTNTSNTTGVVAVAGNLTNDGTFTSQGGLLFGNAVSASSTTLTFSGTSSVQTVSGSGIFRNLVAAPTASLTSFTVNNTSGTSIVIPANMISGTGTTGSVSGTLTLTAGKLDVGATPLIVGISTTTTGTVSSVAGSYIIGEFQRWIGTTTGNRILPIGTSTTPRLAQINFTTAQTTGGKISAKFVASTPGVSGLPIPAEAGNGNIVIGAVSPTGYWQIDRLSGAGGTYTAIVDASGFTKTDGSAITDFANVKLVKRTTAGAWAAGADGTASAIANAAGLATATRTGCTAFSVFALGGTTAALPIELKSFTGKALKASNQLQWITSTEEGVKEHIIERSANGYNNWTLVGTTPSKGDAREEQSYSIEDKTPLTKSFYRLRTLDLDGREQFSNVISLTRQNNSFGVIAAYPNPAVEIINVQFNTLEEGNITARIVDMTGRLVLEQQMSALNGTNMFPVQLNGLSAGTYFITLSSDNEVAEPIRFVKQ
jgi:trimeric autotransporter adhesin